MKSKWNITLLVAMGLLFGVLMLWDLHNQRVITSMGMAWDTGAPLWPYQTPDTLLFALNTPAFLVSTAGSKYFRFGMIGPMHYVSFFPAAVAWWWLVGLYIEKCAGKRRTLGASLMLCLVAIELGLLGIEESRWAFRWWWTYSRSIITVSDLILLRLLAPSIWCFVPGGVAMVAAWRRIGSRYAPALVGE